MKLTGATYSIKNISPLNLAMGTLGIAAGATVAVRGLSAFLYGIGFRGKVVLHK